MKDRAPNSELWLVIFRAASFLRLMFLLTVPSVVQAQFTFTTNNGAITITGYTGSGGTVIIPNTINGRPVTSIGIGAFYGSTNLIGVTIPNSVTNIRQSAFASCGKLTSVTLGSGVAIISDSAFASCTKLTSVTIPNSVTAIGELAFQNCTNLTSVTIGTNVPYISYSAFFRCSSLTAIWVDELNSGYRSVGGVLFDKNLTKLYTYPGGKTGSYIVPAGVITIGFYAFATCSGLTSVTIPESVMFLNGAAFASCPNLTSVYFKGDVPRAGTPGQPVFAYNSNITVYYLPGTTGWGAAFEGMPTVLWNPQVQTNDPSFGVRTNRFGFTITGTTNIPIVVEACTNSTGSAWVSVQSCNLTNGSLYFIDPQWTNYPARFYRLRWP